MPELTPQLTAILDQLVELCCDGLERPEGLDPERTDQLVESLSTNGWERHSTDLQPLASLLEQRVLRHCRDDSMHHPEEVQALCEKIETAYRRQAADSTVPDEARSAGQQADLKASAPRTAQ